MTQTRPRLFRGPYGRASWSVCALVSLYAFEEMGVAAALPNAVADVDGLNHFGWVFTGFLALECRRDGDVGPPVRRPRTAHPDPRLHRVARVRDS